LLEYEKENTDAFPPIRTLDCLVARGSNRPFASQKAMKFLQLDGCDSTKLDRELVPSRIASRNKASSRLSVAGSRLCSTRTRLWSTGTRLWSNGSGFCSTGSGLCSAWSTFGGLGSGLACICVWKIDLTRQLVETKLLGSVGVAFTIENDLMLGQFRDHLDQLPELWRRYEGIESRCTVEPYQLYAPRTETRLAKPFCSTLPTLRILVLSPISGVMETS